jgi:toxin ParE1/3/4
LRNLEDEAEYRSIDDPVAASIVVSRVMDAVKILAEQPNLARPGRIPGTCELVVEKTSYIVPYRVKRQTLEILRVFDTSRRLPKKW